MKKIGFRAILGEPVKGTTQLAQSIREPIREPINCFNLLSRGPIKECNFPSLSSKKVAFLVEGETSLDRVVGLPSQGLVKA